MLPARDVRVHRRRFPWASRDAPSSPPIRGASGYAAAISFSIWRPDSPTTSYWPWRRRFRRFGVSLEALNTRLPIGGFTTYRRLMPIMNMPRLSTYAIGSLINYAVRTMPSSSVYVNVGVWYGFTFFAGLAGNGNRRCIGVDNFSEDFGANGNQQREFDRRFAALRGEMHTFHECTYEEYFATRHADAPIGFYLYDGPHSYEDQLRGLQLADPLLVRGGYILVDDTNPYSVVESHARQATLDFIKSSRGRYELALDQTTATEDHPTFWNGVMLVRRT